MQDLENVEGIGEGENRGVVGGERKQPLKRISVLRRNGVAEAIQVVVDSSVGLSHTQVRHRSLCSESQTLSSSKHRTFLLDFGSSFSKIQSHDDVVATNKQTTCRTYLSSTSFKLSSHQVHHTPQLKADFHQTVLHHHQDPTFNP